MRNIVKTYYWISERVIKMLIDKIRKLFMPIYHLIRRGSYGTREWKRKFGYFGEGACIAWPSELSLDRGKIFIGDNTIIKKNSRLQNYYGAGERNVEIHIGKRGYIGSHFTIMNASKVTIGDDAIVASYVAISSENHGTDPEHELGYANQPLTTKPVSIGDGCWIGEKVCILAGVSIGNKCIIGAASVVTKSIPDYCMAVGNPARIIKKYNLETHSWEKC